MGAALRAPAPLPTGAGPPVKARPTPLAGTPTVVPPPTAPLGVPAREANTPSPLPPVQTATSTSELSATRRTYCPATDTGRREVPPRGSGCGTPGGGQPAPSPGPRTAAAVARLLPPPPSRGTISFGRAAAARPPAGE